MVIFQDRVMLSHIIGKLSPRPFKDIPALPTIVKLIEKFKTRVKNLKIEKIIAFDKYLHELFFAFNFHLSKNLFLTLKRMKLLI